MKNLNIDNLQLLLNKKIVNQDVVEILLLAINDWPILVNNFDEYEFEIYKFIKNETTKTNIEAKLKTINLQSNAWESESLYQLLDIYKHFENGISLKQIIQKLKKYLN